MGVNIGLWRDRLFQSIAVDTRECGVSDSGAGSKPAYLSRIWHIARAKHFPLWQSVAHRLESVGIKPDRENIIVDLINRVSRGKILDNNTRQQLVTLG